MSQPRPQTPCHVEPLPAGIGVERLLLAWRERPGLLALDSVGGAPTRFSLVAQDPLPRGPLGDLQAVRELAASLAPMDVPGPFRGGFIGALAYDLGVAGEGLELPPDAWATPSVVGGLYTDFALLDHSSGEALLVLGELREDPRGSIGQRRAALLAALARPTPAAAAHGVGELTRWVSGPRHRERIEAARMLIAAGEIYQANLAHRFTRRTHGHPLDLYLRLRRVNPAPYAGYLAFGCGPEGGAILCASPELLLECAGGLARTRPIKGTIGRGRSAGQDERRRRMLLNSAKDRAELAMIVDLERNDLARVCQVGSVRVEDRPALESYAAVHHLAADVVGRLETGRDGGDALAALFPGGSVTGAPKLRSMEVIAALEEEGRGFFTGSLGFLGADGQAHFNILIRSLVWRPRPGEAQAGEVSFHVGGGVTWSSEAVAEERETLDKGAALAAALAGPGEVPDTLGAVLRTLAAPEGVTGPARAPSKHGVVGGES